MSELANYYSDRQAYENTYQNAVANATGLANARRSEYEDKLREYQEKKEDADQTYEQIRSAIEGIGTPTLEEGLKGGIRYLQGKLEDRVRKVSSDLIKRYGLEGGQARFEAGLEKLKQRGVDLSKNVEQRARASFEKARLRFRNLLPNEAPRPTAVSAEDLGIGDRDIQRLRQLGELPNRVSAPSPPSRNLIDLEEKYRQDPLYSTKSDQELQSDFDDAQERLSNLKNSRNDISQQLKDTQQRIDNASTDVERASAGNTRDQLNKQFQETSDKIDDAEDDLSSARDLLNRRKAVNSVRDAEGRTVKSLDITRATDGLERPSMRLPSGEVPFSQEGETGIDKGVRAFARTRTLSQINEELPGPARALPGTAERVEQDAIDKANNQRIALQEQQQSEAEAEARTSGTPQTRSPETESNRTMPESMGEGNPESNPARPVENASPESAIPDDAQGGATKAPNPEAGVDSDALDTGAKALAKSAAEGTGEEVGELATEDLALGGPENPIGDVITGITGLAMVLGGIFAPKHHESPPAPPPRPPAINPAAALGL